MRSTKHRKPARDPRKAAAALLRRNLLLWGVGGIIAPFIGIKLIDILISALGVS